MWRAGPVIAAASVSVCDPAEIERSPEPLCRPDARDGPH